MLSANRVLDCDVCEAVRRSSVLLPLLQGSLRDLQPQRGFVLREIFAFAPLSQSSWERLARSLLMLTMSGPGSVGHSAHAIRESRIATRAM